MEKTGSQAVSSVDEATYMDTSEDEETYRPPDMTYDRVIKIKMQPKTTDLKADYEVGSKLLGKGNNSYVAAGQRKSDGMAVAIKFIPIDQARTAQIRNGTCWVEPAVMNQLADMPLVVKIIDCYVDTSHLYVITERLSNSVNLHKFLGDRRRLDEEQAKAVCRQILAALTQIHSRGIYHGDLKEANLMVDKSSLSVKLIDFGSADTISARGCAVFYGSKLYSPPEWRQTGKLTADGLTVWSFGKILYRMLYGRLPFNCVNDTYEGITHLPFLPKLSNSCIDLLTRCLAVNYRRRLSLEEAASHPWLAPAKSAGAAKASTVNMSEHPLLG